MTFHIFLILFSFSPSNSFFFPLGNLELLNLEQEIVLDIAHMPANNALETAARKLDREQ